MHPQLEPGTEALGAAIRHIARAVTAITEVGPKHFTKRELELLMPSVAALAQMTIVFEGWVEKRELLNVIMERQSSQHLHKQPRYQHHDEKEL